MSSNHSSVRKSSLILLALWIALALFGTTFFVQPAHALPTGTKGWCTPIKNQVGFTCGFESAYEACVAQMTSFSPRDTLYGAFPFGTNWYFRKCEWSLQPDPIRGAGVHVECTDALLKPNAPNGCEGPPQGDDGCGEKNKGSNPFGQTRHPIDLLSGTKRFKATDFVSTDGSLALERMYSSLASTGSPTPLAAIPIGLANWRYGFQLELQISSTWESTRTVTVALSNGTAITFARQTNGSMAAYTPSKYPLPQTDYTLTYNGTWPTDLNTIRAAKTFWTLRDADDNVWSLETFADPYTGDFIVARPTQLTKRSGLQITFAYGTAGQLTSMTDSFGKAITFDWFMQDSSTLGGTVVAIPGAIKQANLPGGYKLKYTYNAMGSSSGIPQQDRLIKVELTDAADTVQDSTTYQYGDANFKNGITSILDKNNVQRWLVTYDTDGHATSSQGPGGVDAATVAYGALGTTFARTVTNALGKSAIYNYTKGSTTYNVRLVSINGQASTNCPASTGSFAYGTNNLLSSSTDEEGRITTYTRNTNAQVTQQVEASGTANARTTTITWHSTFNVPTQIVRPGLTTTLTYDTQGRLTQRTETDTTTQTIPYSTNGQTRTWTYTWSTGGQLLTVDGPLAGISDKTTYTYATNGYLATITNGLGHVTTVTATNWRGQPTQVLDANGIYTNFTHDALGHVISVAVNPGANQAQTSFQYNAVGQITQVTAPNGVVLTYAYNDAKQLTSISNAIGEKIEYIYDAMGNATMTNFKTTAGVIVQQIRNTYDELGRTMKDIGAANQETRYAYDKVDNNTQITDPNSKIYGHAFDQLNRLTRETDPNLGQTNVAYNANDSVASVTNARNHATSFVTNGWGEPIRETSPDRGITDYVRDARGLITQTTDARGQVVNYTYDGLGRMTTRSFPGAPTETITWAYDSIASGNKGVGRLTGVTDPSGTVSYTYNLLGQVSRITRSIGTRVYQTDYFYDLAGNLTQMTMPSGRIVTYVRDSLARVTGVSTADNSTSTVNTVVSSVAWRPFGALSSMSFGNGLALTLGYDNDGRITGMGTSGAGSTVQSLSYGYDLASNITSIADAVNSNRSQTFIYDSLNRLTSATGLYGTNTYSYDAVGNRTQRTVTLPVAGTETYAVSTTSNRLNSISGGTTRSFGYEASGQVSTDQRPGASNWTYTIDKAGRMASASLNGSSRASFAYDGDELRIRKTNVITGAVTHYLYDTSGQLIAEMDDATGAPVREYVWLGALPAGYIDHLGAGGTSRLFYIHADHLGRPQKITDSARTIAWDGVFAPFGEIHSISGSIVNVLMFPGQVYDSETGLTQNWHREYDTNIGRYLQSDSIGLVGGINTYAYVNGNPNSQVDPNGQFGIGGALVGAGFEISIQALNNYIRGCDLFALDNYDWGDVAVSAAVGFVAPGSLAVGRRFLTARSATRTLSQQLAATRSVRRATKLQRRISDHWLDFSELFGWQLGWQGAKAAGKLLDGEVPRNCTCSDHDPNAS